MKKLIVIASMGLALGFPTFSLADSYVFGVKTPIVRSEVKNQVKGGNVEKDFISFYATEKTPDAGDISRAQQGSDDDGRDYIIVFGVKVPVTPKV